MPFFTNDRIKIYYEIEGEGPPVVMIHGFASSLEGTWKHTNWIETLKDNYRVILLDCRGHGKSDKPHGNSDYGQKMNDDIIKLMEHLSIDKANFFGYSMGAALTFRLLVTNPEIIISAILGGYVLTLDEKHILKDIKYTKQIIDGLRATNISQIKKPMARAFRQFAEQHENDLLALAAVQASFLEDEVSELINSPDHLRKLLKNIKLPIMTIMGSNEILAGDKTLIAQLVPDACHFQIQGKDHLTAPRDPKSHMVVKAFLDYVNRR
ncbi:MAG: alpha/beta hydrolase [Candidatus Lokiarchaeia archaeon]|nr:alpha/beta hydrolase [Candidatus Lokiarchaeia archaeon]